jgi:Ca2+-transporting ATPase
MIGVQILIIFVGGAAFSVVKLNAAQWACCIILGFISIPLGMCIRLIPDELLMKAMPLFLSSKLSTRVPPVVDEEQQFQFPQSLADYKEELSFLKKVKGGRLKNLNFAIRYPWETFLPRPRSGSGSRASSRPRTPESRNSRTRRRSVRSRSNSASGAAAVMAGIIAASIGNWSPVQRNNDEVDSLRLSRSLERLDPDSREGETLAASDSIIVQEPSIHEPAIQGAQTQ